MMPEIKKFTSLNIEREMWTAIKSKDFDMIEIIYNISHYILTDNDCIFIYDLADCVEAKHIDCYLRQYWKAYWNNPDFYNFVTPFIIRDLLKERFIKYASELLMPEHQHLYDYMFLSINSHNWSDCPYAE